MTDAAPPHRAPAAPTHQQGADPSASPHRPGRTVPTVQQGVPATTPTTHQRAPGLGGAAPTLHQVGPRVEADLDALFPVELTDRFRRGTLLGHGSEGTVWRCTDQNGRTVAVKINNKLPMDMDLLEHLDNPRFGKHVPRIYDFGTVLTLGHNITWASMECLPITLETYARPRPDEPRLDEPRAKAVLAGTAACLAFWQNVVERNPLDFKPDNLMIRSMEPPEIVLADFGGVSAFTASQQMGGTFMASHAYKPPEHEWTDKRSPWPWWSLGEIAYMLITGRSRHEAPDGTTYSPEESARIRGLGELELPEVPERWRRLIRGLLTRDSAYRWNHTQVLAWLDDQSPPVHQERIRIEDAPAHRPITFVDGRTFTDPGDLAVHLLAHPSAAENWLLGPRKQDLADWLRDEDLGKRFDRTLLRNLRTGDGSVPNAVLAFGAAFAPDAQPAWRGHPVDADGLLRLPASEGGLVLREMVDAGGFGAAAAFHCGHPTCATGHCAQLMLLATHLRDTVTAAERVIIEAGPAAARARHDRLHFLAAVVLLAPAHATQLVDSRMLRELTVAQRWHNAWRTLRGSDPVPGWWPALWRRVRTASPHSADGRALLTAAPVLAEAAAAEAAEWKSEQREWLRAQARRGARATGLCLVTFAGLVLLAWSVAVFITSDPEVAVTVMGGAALGADPVGIARALAPALLILAVEVMILSGRVASWVVAGGVVAAGLGAVGGRLPEFTALSLPGAFDGLLAELARVPPSDRQFWAAAGVAIGLGCLWLVFSRRGGHYRLGGQSPSTPVGLRRLAAFPLLLTALLTTLWATGVGTTVLLSAAEPATDFPGLDMAEVQSGYLLLFAGLAAAAAVKWPRTSPLFALAILFAAGVGALPDLRAELTALYHPALTDQFVALAGVWGANGFWTSVLVAPVVVLFAIRLAHRLARR